MFFIRGCVLSFFVAAIAGCGSPAQPVPNNVETPQNFNALSAYETGVQEGITAACQQFGLPILTVAISKKAGQKYVIQSAAEHDNAPNYNYDDRMRGYVDGYHRAMDAVYCPADTVR